MTDAPHDDDDTRARGSRTYRDAHRSGTIEGALWALGKEAVDVLDELVRRYGTAPVERVVACYPDTRAAFEHAAANADTRPIDLGELHEHRPNSPQEVGAREEPGGWTGGLTPPTEQQRRRVRREDRKP